MKDDPRFRQVDASKTPRFADVATFMRTKRMDICPDIDIALVGVPYDLGTNVRSGARQGPAAVREASRIIRRVHPVTKDDPFALANVADIGDAPVNPHQRIESIDMIQAFFEEVAGVGAWPLAIGGDHTIPLPILRAVARGKPVGIVHFDAHSDTLDVNLGTKINHATTWRRAIEEGLVDPKRMVQIGLRGSQFDEHDISYGYEAGMRVITMDDYEAMGRAKVIEAVGETIGDGPTYVSFDIDGLDAAYAMGTGVPEIGGLLPRDAQVIIRSLRGRDIIGADISEVAPIYDVTGQTQLNAANLMFELLCVMAHNRARGPRLGK